MTAGSSSELASGPSRRDAAELRVGVAPPDLRAQQARGERDERVTEVGQHDVVVLGGDVMVEGDRPRASGDRVLEVGDGPGPRLAEARDGERLDRFVEWPLDDRRPKRGLARQLERDLDDPLDGGGADAQFVAALSQAQAQPVDLLAEVALECRRCPAAARRRGRSIASSSSVRPVPEHRLLELRLQHRAGAAEIVADRVDLDARRA